MNNETRYEKQNNLNAWLEVLLPTYKSKGNNKFLEPFQEDNNFIEAMK